MSSALFRACSISLLPLALALATPFLAAARCLSGPVAPAQRGQRPQHARLRNGGEAAMQ